MKSTCRRGLEPLFFTVLLAGVQVFGATMFVVMPVVPEGSTMLTGTFAALAPGDVALTVTL